jgi:hypothetical protein
MENSGKIFFEDDGPNWYVALGERWSGPLSAADVYAQILDGKLTWAHFVWKSGQKNWTRICDTPAFQVAVPQLPAQGVMKEVKQAASPGGKKMPPPAPKDAPALPGASDKPWFLYYSDSQYGPFSQEEVERFLQVGRIHRKVHVWRDGMKNWDRIEEVAEFRDAVVDSLMPEARSKREAPPSQGRAQDLRASPRAPLVAKIMVASGQSLSVAMCRDISVGGMQVLTDKVPGDVGLHVKLNVSSDQIEPFVAEGIIVRILEDKRGFSFRFDRLPESARRAIETYVASL